MTDNSKFDELGLVVDLETDALIPSQLNQVGHDLPTLREIGQEWRS